MAASVAPDTSTSISTSTTPATDAVFASPATCQHCGKASSENNTLKKCGKCKTVMYCSRDCQKADFQTHKKVCRATAAGIGPPAPIPLREEILKAATASTDFLVKLMACPDSKNATAEKPLPPILQHLIGFVSRTMAEYWTPLLPMRKSLELSSRVRDDPAAYLESATAKIKEMSERGVDIDAWPPFKPELYTDALGRHFMALMVVSDESKQSMFGTPPGQVYQWSDAIKEEVRKQQKERK